MSVSPTLVESDSTEAVLVEGEIATFISPLWFLRR